MLGLGLNFRRNLRTKASYSSASLLKKSVSFLKLKKAFAPRGSPVFLQYFYSSCLLARPLIVLLSTSLYSLPSNLKSSSPSWSSIISLWEAKSLKSLSSGRKGRRSFCLGLFTRVFTNVKSYCFPVFYFHNYRLILVSEFSKNLVQGQDILSRLFPHSVLVTKPGFCLLLVWGKHMFFSFFPVLQLGVFIRKLREVFGFLYHRAGRRKTQATLALRFFFLVVFKLSLFLVLLLLKKRRVLSRWLWDSKKLIH